MGSPRIQPFIPRWTTGRRSVVTLLIVASVMAFIGQVFVQMADPAFIKTWMCLSMNGIRQGYYWQFFTYLFIHGDPRVPASGLIHLFINMTTLYFVGREVEAIAGPRHLLGMYFLGGFAGGLAQIMAVPGIPVGGASAGVCAALVAFATILPEFEATLLLFFVVPIRLKAKHVGWLVVGASLLMEAMHWAPNIAHMAHLGGCLVGWLYARQLGFGNPWYFQRRMAEKRQREARLNRMSPDQFMVEEIDPILDKISREGIRALSRGERRILERGRDKISQKDIRISVR
ncbi:MAG TPA: rhomboid family intramembrane serine protease [Chthoniobacteraceae bacterium]|jgi:membrane associated rhomboid family serine protease|nr:rhomboid family intramembrane serine protease [Chthoniobacteraceae bacterium]